MMEVSNAPTIRALKPSDHAAWEVLWNGYLTFYAAALPAAVTKTTWSRLHDPQEPMHALVAEHQSDLLGLVHFLYHRSTWSVGPYCYLQDLFTAEAARGRGIARALIDAVYKKARSAGASRVYWLTHESNDTARILYDKVATRSGFIQYRQIF